MELVLRRSHNTSGLGPFSFPLRVALCLLGKVRAVKRQGDDSCAVIPYPIVRELPPTPITHPTQLNRNPIG